MDVTFFEEQPYYHKTNIQEETQRNEYQLWDIDTLESTYAPTIEPAEQLSEIAINQLKKPLKTH